MNAVYLALAALLFSAIPILLLCAGDPKRGRAAGARGGMAAGHRRLLVLTAIGPGLVCLLLGEAAAFIMWLGGSALVGWSVASFLPGHYRTRE